MLQELFRIPFFDIPIFSYGLMMVIGFLCATQLARYLARRTGINPDIIVNAGLIALVTGVIGARLSHVFENWAYFTDASRSVSENFLDAINIRSGGLTYYGGFLLATPCTIAYGLWKRVPIRHGMDIIAPALMVGLAFGRIGCFLNGCCYGATCNVPYLGVQFPYYSNVYVETFQSGAIEPGPNFLRQLENGRMILKTPAELRAEFGDIEATRIMAENRAHPVHPAQLYSAFTAFFLAGLLVALFTLPHPQGSVFMLMLILEGASRFVLELLRAEPAVAQTTWGGMSFSMFVSVALVIAGIAGWLVVRRMAPRTDVLTLDPADAQTKHHARAMATRD